MRGLIYVVFIMLMLLSVMILSGCGASDGRGNSDVSEVSSSGLLAVDKSTNFIKTAEDGSIEGAVNTALLNHDSCTGGNAVYMYKGYNVIPDDIDGISADPIELTQVKFDHSSERYNYRFSSLKAGDYTLAFTCQAEADDHAVDYGIHFIGISNVKVIAGERIIKHLFPSRI
jgi:hypothetical protein